MSLNAKRGGYPYSKNRVFLSVAVAVLSIILVLTTLLGDATLLIYYAFSTCVVIIITFLLKKRFYSLLTTEAPQKTTENEDKRTSWKVLIATFLMLIGLTMVPLLLAGLLSGPAWFIMITSFTSGVSISEIGLYVQANRNR